MAMSSTPTQNLKHRIFTCLTKLSDRDTHSIASSELESIARNLEESFFSTFLSCIHSTDASDKSPVRKQCVQLLATLSEAHGNTLSPHLTKMLSSITRRLRDPDSSVRTACVNSVTALASHVTKPPFSAFLKPLADALFTEQDLNSQIGAALCLASAIDASDDPDPARLGKLLPRFEKLLKSESFKAKPALLVLIGSVIDSGGASGHAALSSLVPCLVQFLNSEDWAARKSAAEALTKLAAMEADLLSELKANCVKTFENRRFDKVKAVREAINQLLEAWKQIPDVSTDGSPPPHVLSTSKDTENTTKGCYSAGSKKASISCLDSPQLRKKIIPSNRSTPSDNSLATTARKRSPFHSTDKKSTPMFRKLDRKKQRDWKVEITIPNASSLMENVDIEQKEKDEKVLELNEKTRISKLETKRALFNKTNGSRVAPCEESFESTVVVSNVADDLPRDRKDSEDLSLIRNQLVQIEKQQSSLLDLLQRFIGSSQNGMHSLETRVHGLELALDEISYDLALSSGRMTKTDSSPGPPTCCLLPGADFLSSKFWRKTEGGGRYSTSRLSSSMAATTTPSMAARRRYIADRTGNGGGFIVNPLAAIDAETRVNLGNH